MTPRKWGRPSAKRRPRQEQLAVLFLWAVQLLCALPRGSALASPAFFPAFIPAFLGHALAALPTAAVERPASIALLPTRLVPVITHALAFPVTPVPIVAAVAPVPVAWCPDEALARSGDYLVARRGRSDVEKDSHFRGSDGGGQSDGRSQQRAPPQFTFPHESSSPEKE